MARCGLLALFLALCPFGINAQRQSPLIDPGDATPENEDSHPRLHGRFLQITDLHPDSHYLTKSKTNSKHVCHSGSGKAGYFGAPGTDCDAPWTLVDATMEWIRDNLKDSIDFVVWTGDSARHDNDENNPRTEKELVESNRVVVEKMLDVFSDNNGTSDGHLQIPIVPNIGNNDIMPHNIFKSGPNRWTKTFRQLWESFIPETQHHSFSQGGWFYVEVIPDKLAVFSLNTMYFYKSNSAVDGCKLKSDPGYQHMEWLRVQLQLLRDRKMKAILIGHIPPARSKSKKYWYESCWQKYALWLKQYRDVIVGNIFGHMNIDHFIIQDFNDLEIGGNDLTPYDVDDDDEDADNGVDDYADEEEENSSDGKLSVRSKTGYLESLKDLWSKLPIPPPGYSQLSLKQDEGPSTRGKKAKKKFLKKIGGPWAERYALSFVPPSIIPLYFPTLRVVEYNISGLEGAETWSHRDLEPNRDGLLADGSTESLDSNEAATSDDAATSKKKNKKKKKKKKKKSKFKVPKSPASKDTPGPAYSNQPLTWLGYTQYFANITEFNAKVETSGPSPTGGTVATLRDYLRSKLPDSLAHRDDESPFKFEVEYDTMTDSVYKLNDLTVNSYLDLARRISGIQPQTTEPDMRAPDEEPVIRDDNQQALLNVSLAGGHENEEIAAKQTQDAETASKNHVWKTFLRRAFVNSRDG